jgi:hypothetical protein
LDRDLMHAGRFRALSLLLALAFAAGCSVSTTTDEQSQHGDDRPTDVLHDRGAAARAVAAIERRVGASPARTSEVLVYPQYLDMKAQDPSVPEHIDEYEWRDGSVSGPEPVHLSGPQEAVDASLFPTTAVRWRDIPDFVEEVETRARHARPIRVEDAVASYLIVERSTSSGADGRVEITIYLSGPRRSGYAELTASGEIVALHVS